MTNDRGNVTPTLGGLGDYSNRVLLAGCILHREYVPYSHEIVKTDVSVLGRQLRAMKCAVEAAVRTLDHNVLLPGIRYRVDEIELVETKGVGPAVFLERSNECVPECEWRQISEQQQEMLCELMNATLLIRAGSSNRLFGASDETQSTVAEAFANAFNQRLRSAVEVLLLDPRDIDPRRIVFFDAVAKERPVVTSEPMQIMKGTVAGFRAGKNSFVLERPRGKGSIEVEITKPQDFLARLVVLFLARQPCELTLGVSTLHEGTGRQTTSFTLLAVEAVLEHDWSGTLGMLSSAAEFLSTHSVAQEDWARRDASNPQHNDMSQAGGNSGSKQQSMHGFGASQDTGVSLKQRDSDPAPARSERATRRRKKWDPF